VDGVTEDFLLELRSEEIPARMQERARTDLAALFEARLKALNLPFERIESYATPRRLALIVRGVAETTTAATEERKGPRADAPAQAIEGFLRSTGLSRDQLVARDDGKGGQVLFAVIERPGVPAGSVLASATTHAIHNFAWPKSMRWGQASQSTESLRWVRPLQGVVALLGDKLVPVEVAGIRSGVQTVGHRFHHPGVITIGSANDYVEKLRACHVIVDGAERRAIIAVGAKMAAQKAGLTLVEDEGLLFENAGLTEWPVPLLGRFDPDFLSVPPEVIQLTARVNQKYFVCSGPDGKLANAFVCTANIDAADGGAKIVEGNQKVLAARLSDARFFYETDLRTKLEDLTPKLGKIVFHEKLGTVAGKVDRVAKLAEWLATEGVVPNCDPKLARRAAELAKADLVTGMVGEFPELQGLIGGYYAAAQGEDVAVAEAIRDHYKPVGQGDEVPTAPVTVAVSLADKLDTLACFFELRQPPSGSKDPFALRRAALGFLSIVDRQHLRFSLLPLLGAAVKLAGEATLNQPGEARLGVSRRRIGFAEAQDEAAWSLLDFFADRLKVQQREAGVRHDLIDAVFALGGEDDLVRLLARVHALQAFVGTEDGKNLLAGYKRAANILKKENWPASAPVEAGARDGSESGGPGLLLSQEHGYVPEPEEADLVAALASAEPKATAAIEREDFEAAMAALATLRAPIDAFFDKVTVNDADPAKREARLNLLARMRDAVHKVADFSKIEG
jgi:glycyl-tRNA synthetase beta chain